jgi:hypothetical protein
MIYPHHDGVSGGYPALSGKEKTLVDSVSVTRVRPRTSKGITDLLLPQTSIRWRVRIVPLRSRAANFEPLRTGSRDYLAG